MQKLDAAHATIRLWGHPHVSAELEVERYPVWIWVGRVGLFLLWWIIGTLSTLLLTFDPFMAWFPFVLGMALVYRGIVGRYRVHAFSGVCPRCGCELKLRPGSKINLPCKLDCFSCHFEPELHLSSERLDTDA